MKNLILCTTFFILASVSNALLVNNGGFDADAANWELTGGTGGGTATWGGTHIASGGNPGGFLTLEEDPGTTWAWTIWYQSGTEDFDVWGIPAETTLTMSVDIKAIGASALDHVYLKMEAHNTGGMIDEYEEQLVPPVTTSWLNYSIDYMPPAGANGVKCILVAKDATSAAEIAFDNIEILIPGGTPALMPVPFVGKGAGVTTTEVTWANPDPNELGGTVTATAYLLASDVELTDPNLSPDDFDPGVVILTVDTPDYESAPVSLFADKYYYWAVHVTDSGTGITVPGFTWDFQTFDSPPVVDAGADQYLSGASPLTITLNATASDDHPGETYLWTDITAAGDFDPATTVLIDTPTTEDTTVTLTNAGGVVSGYYQFTLTVTDTFTPTAQVTADSIAVGVYGTCAEAADADPDDPYDPTGDLDGNCKKDLADFATFAAMYLDCDSLRITCP